MPINTEISRKSFLKIASLGGVGLCLGLFGAGTKMGALSNAEIEEALQSIELNAWVIIDTGGRITFVDHRAEMGQGSFHSVPQILAEELEVDLNDINVIFGKGDKKKWQPGNWRQFDHPFKL